MLQEEVKGVEEEWQKKVSEVNSKLFQTQRQLSFLTGEKEEAQQVSLKLKDEVAAVQEKEIIVILL